MSIELTKEMAYKELQEFFREKAMVLFGTGTSCALDSHFGMDALQEQLSVEIPKLSLSSSQKLEWEEVVNAISGGKDLESAMDAVEDSKLISHVIRITAEFLSALDRKYSAKVLMGIVEWPAHSLFKKLFDGLPETDRILHVATPNYDLLAEYAFEQAGIPYITGFVGGICRRLDWQECERSVTCFENCLSGHKLRLITKCVKHVRLYKVHGSLNTFKLNSIIVENNSWMSDVPDIVERIMIIPGTSKYKQLHQNRNDLLGAFDEAIKHHAAFLFIGFGFNDSQLNNDSLIRKLKIQKCPGLIITKDSNKQIQSLLEECDNLWLVCKHQDENNEDTRIFNRKYANWLHLADKRLWDTREFTNEILGG